MRVPISLKVIYSHRGNRIESYLTILGEGGLFVSSSKPVPLGSKLKFEIKPLGSGPSFTVPGKVVWVGKDEISDEDGMGIMFFDLSPLHKRTIYALIDDTIRQNLLERRKSSRIDTRLTISARHQHKVIGKLTHDLSLGGMFVATDQIIKPDEIAEFELKLGSKPTTIRGTATVIHRAEKPGKDYQCGFGAHFTGLKTADKLQILTYIMDRVTGKTRHAQDEPRQHAPADNKGSEVRGHGVPGQGRPQVPLRAEAVRPALRGQL